MTLHSTRSAVLAIGLLVLTSGVAAQAETFLECQAGQMSDDDFEAVACAVQLNDQLWHDAEEIHDFCTASSSFYPRLARWYDEANDEWLANEVRRRTEVERDQ